MRDLIWASLLLVALATVGFAGADNEPPTINTTAADCQGGGCYYR